MCLKIFIINGHVYTDRHNAQWSMLRGLLTSSELSKILLWLWRGTRSFWSLRHIMLICTTSDIFNPLR